MTMMDSHEPRPFDCPDCGHHHEADLHAMVGHPEVHGKVPCAGCGKVLWLSLNDAGEAVVELYEEHLHEQAHLDRVAAHKAKLEAERAAAEAAQAAKSASGGTAPMLVAVVVSALVAAIVTGWMNSRADADDGKAKPEKTATVDDTSPGVDGLKDELASVRGAADAAAGDARTVKEAFEAFAAEVGTRLEVIAAAPKDGADASEAIQAAKAEIVAQLQKLESANTELGNRIEGYYVTVRQLESRLKKLETP